MLCFFIGIMVAAIPLFVSFPNAWGAYSNTNVFVQSMVDSGIYFSANPGTYQTIITGQASGTNGGYSRVIRLIASNQDTTTDHVVTCQQKTSGGTVLAQWQVLVPHQTGVITPVDLKSTLVYPGLPIDPNGNTYIGLYNADIVQCTYATALSNGAIPIVGETQYF